MKRFIFNLEKILDLRRYHEQEAKNELGRAIGILNEIENRIKQNAIRQSHAIQERFAGINNARETDASESATSGSAASDMISWTHYINHLEQEALRLTEDAAKAEMVVEEKRNLYMEALRELKVIEKLKEKQKKEHRAQAFAAETAELDDLFRGKRE